MKATIIGVLVVVMMVVSLHFWQSEPITYVKEQTMEVVNQPENPDSWKLELLKDEDAVKAAQAVIRKKELEAELVTLDTQIKELQARRKSVTDELTTY